MRNVIITALKKYKSYVSASNMLKQYIERFPDPDRMERFAMLEARRIIIECWLGLLSDDELHVVHRHLIDGLSWSRLHLEYEHLWGEENARSERMLKINQANAIRKMEEFSEEYALLVEELFSTGEEDTYDGEKNEA